MTNARAYDALFSVLARERASLLPGLHLLQRHDGYVSIDGLRALANHIRVPAVEVHAAASTYSELRRAAAPAGLRRICTGLACRLNGADGLVAEALKDGGPIEEVPCLFACGVAPVVEVGNPLDVYGKVQSLLALAERKGAEAGDRASRAGSLAGAHVLVGGGSCGRAAGSQELIAELRRSASAAEVIETGCDGACWAQPLIRVRGSTDAESFLSLWRDEDQMAGYTTWHSGQTRILLKRCGDSDPTSIDDYRAQSGYQAWEMARGVMRPAEVQRLVAESGLLGRGGAYFPVARKWETAINSAGDVFLVVNLEEGEPGVFKDRHLCEGDPHAVVEGILIAAFALQAPRLYVYINGQADLSAVRITNAIAQARAAGLVPDGLFIEIVRGAGGYVCGEESVILNSIEGHRAVPRLRPPFPAEVGLWGHPTVVNNAETLANLPLIVRLGPEWFRSSGTGQAPGTKLLCLAGALPRPGLVEVPFGTPLRHVIGGIGGASPEKTIALVMGGPSGGFVPARLLDIPLRPGVLDAAGAILGAGGVTVVDETLSPLEVARQLTAYNAAESCGKCTPCREGTARTEAILASVASNRDDEGEEELLVDLNEAIRLASLCGLGQAAPNPIASLLEHFPPQGWRGTVQKEQDGPPATLARAEREPGA